MLTNRPGIRWYFPGGQLTQRPELEHTNPSGVLGKSMLGTRLLSLSLFPVGMSASLAAAAAAAAVVTEPEKAFSSRAPAAGAAGAGDWRVPGVLSLGSASLLSLFDSNTGHVQSFPVALRT